jgi:prepilin-type N-terminal cleavage/methylation domain-containing protein
MATMKRLPFFFAPQATCQRGYTLAELCVVLAIAAITLGLAAPALNQWFWRLRVDTAMHAWATDLQAAQLQALRHGEYLQLQRLSNCLSSPLPAGDWRCGWQVVFKSGHPGTPLLSSPLTGELQVQLNPSQNSLDINPQGEAVAGGLRLVVRPRGNVPVVRSICINTTGRLRWVMGSSCT